MITDTPRPNLPPQGENGQPTETADYADFAHTGPGTLAGRYLRRFWQPIYRAEDLAPGRAVPVQLMSEWFTLYRGETGTPHLVGFRCAHRGTQLSVGWVEADCLRCRYHGWKYNESGQCVEQPGEDPSFAARVRIPTYPIQEYLGLLFAYIGEGEPPPLRRYPEFESEPVLEIYRPDVWPCNYFNRLDNFCDVGHVAFTHRESTLRRTGKAANPRRITAQETDYGIKTHYTAEGEPPSLTFVDMPNTNHLGRSTPGGRPGERLFFRVPIDDGHCVSYCVERTYLVGEAAEAYRERRRQMLTDALSTSHEVGAEVLAGKRCIEDLDVRTQQGGTGYTDIFWIEDYAMQVGQGTIAPRSEDRLAKVDVGVALMRQIWQRELRALAEGRPLKDWASSAGLGDPPTIAPAAR